MTTDEVVLDYIADADELEELAHAARTDGWTYWATELEGYAAIAKRAADAEADDPEPRDIACNLCGGVRKCDIEWHAARRLIK